MATVIMTAAELAGISDMAGEYELGADIAGYNAACIGSDVNLFTGKLDGKGFTISGDFSTGKVVGTSKYFGLFFGLNGAEISNIVFSGCTIDESSEGEAWKMGDCGFICAYATGSTFTNIQFQNCSIALRDYNSPRWCDCGMVAGYLYTSATLTSITTDASCSITFTYGGHQAGMLAGGMEAVTASKCGCKGSVTGCYIAGAPDIYTGEVGGMFGSGFTSAGSATDCYSQVECTGYFVGGFIAASDNGTFTHCYSSGDVTILGGGLGYGFGYDGSGNSVDAVYWRTGCGENGGEDNLGASTSDADMQLQATYSGWDFASIWVMVTYPEFIGYPTVHIQTLRSENVTQHTAVLVGLYRVGEASYDLGFKYRIQNYGDWADAAIIFEQTFVGRWYLHDLEFKSAVGALVAGLTYEFKAYVAISGTYYYGSVLTFQTPNTDEVWLAPGEEYRTARQALDNLTKVSDGRYYADKSGNLQYESRLRRET